MGRVADVGERAGLGSVREVELRDVGGEGAHIEVVGDNRLRGGEPQRLHSPRPGFHHRCNFLPGMLLSFGTNEGTQIFGIHLNLEVGEQRMNCSNKSSSLGYRSMLP